MRWLTATAFLALAIPVSAQPNDAEKLFRAMEKQVREAKTFKVGFDLEADLGKAGPAKIKGTLTVAPGNKARLDAKGTADGKERTLLMIADGKQRLYTEGNDNAKPEPLEHNLSVALPQILARAGVFAMFETSPGKDAFDIDKQIPASDFKFGIKEKVGTREAQQVQYSLKPGNLTVQATVWLDIQTNVPLKRVLTGVNPDKQMITVTETYTEITLNPTVDNKIFELPK
jgi:outer membrane lipoprotein-sorting protein